MSIISTIKDTHTEEYLKKFRTKYNDQTEVPAQTLEALRAGEEWAYNKVYARFATPLKDFLTMLIQNEEDAKELNHDVFMSLWNGREKIVPEKGIKGFLFMRAKNLAMNYFDRKKVREKYDDFCSRDTEFSLAPDEFLIGNETRLLIEIALEGMPEKKRIILIKRFEEGKSIEQIAQELNLSPSTVKNNLSMTVKALRDVVALFTVLFLS